MEQQIESTDVRALLDKLVYWAEEIRDSYGVNGDDDVEEFQSDLIEGLGNIIEITQQLETLTLDSEVPTKATKESLEAEYKVIEQQMVYHLKQFIEKQVGSDGKVFYDYVTGNSHLFNPIELFNVVIENQQNLTQSVNENFQKAMKILLNKALEQMPDYVVDKDRWIRKIQPKPESTLKIKRQLEKLTGLSLADISENPERCRSYLVVETPFVIHVSPEMDVNFGVYDPMRECGESYEIELRGQNNE